MNNTLRIAMYTIGGTCLFICLSFIHDGFRTDRDIQTYYLPICVGFTVGLAVGYLQNRMEERTRKYERQLSTAREEAALGRAAAAIAHELRNPLNALGMGLQRLEMEAQELTCEHRQLLALMLKSVHGTDQIINGLMDYARPLKANLRALRLDLLLEEMLLLYFPECKEKGIRVDRELEFKENIFADADLLRQVVHNLLLNAIQAQTDGGFIHIQLKRAGEEASLKIRNSGFSLAPGQAGRIFEPYFTTKVRGTGLGLTVARRIIEFHHGRIEASAGEDDQVTIAVYLPLKKVADRLSAKEDI